MLLKCINSNKKAPKCEELLRESLLSSVQEKFNQTEKSMYCYFINTSASKCYLIFDVKIDIENYLEKVITDERIMEVQ